MYAFLTLKEKECWMRIDTEALSECIEKAKDNQTIVSSFVKAAEVLSKHDSVLCSISGGGQILI